MKKIFTIILAAAGTISAASAQSKQQRNIAYNDHKVISKDYGQQGSYGKTKDVNYNDAYFSYKEKEAKLASINRSFDQKIASVKSNRHLSSRQKTKQIQLLQNQRKNEISKVAYQYSDSNKGGHETYKW